MHGRGEDDAGLQAVQVAEVAQHARRDAHAGSDQRGRRRRRLRATDVRAPAISEDAGQEGQHDASHGHDRGARPDAQQIGQAGFEPDEEQQEDHAKLGQHVEHEHQRLLREHRLAERRRAATGQVRRSSRARKARSTSPASSSPMTGGCCRRCDNSPASFATANTTKTWAMISPTPTVLLRAARRLDSLPARLAPRRPAGRSAPAGNKKRLPSDSLHRARDKGRCAAPGERCFPPRLYLASQGQASGIGRRLTRARAARAARGARGGGPAAVSAVPRVKPPPLRTARRPRPRPAGASPRGAGQRWPRRRAPTSVRVSPPRAGQRRPRRLAPARAPAGQRGRPRLAPPLVPCGRPGGVPPSAWPAVSCAGAAWTSGCSGLALAGVGAARRSEGSEPAPRARGRRREG